MTGTELTNLMRGLIREELAAMFPASSSQPETLPADRILAAVAAEFRLSISSITKSAARGSRHRATARHMAAGLLHHRARLTIGEIAGIMGWRQQASVIHALESFGTFPLHRHLKDALDRIHIALSTNITTNHQKP